MRGKWPGSSPEEHDLTADKWTREERERERPVSLCKHKVTTTCVEEAAVRPQWMVPDLREPRRRRRRGSKQLASWVPMITATSMMESRQCKTKTSHPRRLMEHLILLFLLLLAIQCPLAKSELAWTNINKHMTRGESSVLHKKGAVSFRGLHRIKR